MDYYVSVLGQYTVWQNSICNYLLQHYTRIALSCGIKNIAGRFFRLVTKHACDGRTDGQTDRITTPKIALA